MGRVFAPDGIRYRRTCGHARPKRVGLAVKLRVPEILITPFPEILITSLPEILAG